MINFCERVVIFAERIMNNKTYATILGFVSLIAPLYYWKTLYVVWFGPIEVYVGFKSERWTWFVMFTVTFIGLFTMLPTRKAGVIMQIVTLLWVINLALVFLATFVR